MASSDKRLTAYVFHSIEIKAIQEMNIAKPGMMQVKFMAIESQGGLSSGAPVLSKQALASLHTRFGKGSTRLHTLLQTGIWVQSQHGSRKSMRVACSVLRPGEQCGTSKGQVLFAAAGLSLRKTPPR